MTRALFVGAAALALWCAPAIARAQEELPPGWALQVGKVVTHAEHAAFALSDGDALHPELEAGAISGAFLGEVRIARAGAYRFQVDGEVASAEIRLKLPTQDTVKETSATWIDLAPGWQPIEVRFTMNAPAVAKAPAAA